MALSLDGTSVNMAEVSPPVTENVAFNTSLISNTELSRFSRPQLTFAATITVIIMIIGILGNLLTIVALVRCPRVRNVAAAFIICLCVADFLFCLLVLPFSTSRYIAGTWVHGSELCTLYGFMQYGNIGVSLLSIAMITINRYIMITHHNMYTRIYKKVWIAAMIIFCWVFSYSMQLPTLFGVWGSFGYDKYMGSCSILEDANGRSSKTALFIIGFCIPCVIIVICYARIFWVVHESESRLRGHSTTPTRASSEDRPTINNTTSMKKQSREQREMRARRNEWRITKMVLAIFLSFVVCYLPITIVKVADSKARYPALHIVGYMMLYLSACINPIIYVIMNKQYRQAYKTVLLFRRPRLLSLTPMGTSSYGDKSKDAVSKTMVSQVSIAMAPIISNKADELPEVFDDNL